MPAPLSPRRRPAGQLSAGSGRGELPLWAVLVVATGVLVLGLHGAGEQGSESWADSQVESELASARPMTLDPPVAPVDARAQGGLAQLVALEANGDGSGRLMGRSDGAGDSRVTAEAHRQAPGLGLVGHPDGTEGADAASERWLIEARRSEARPKSLEEGSFHKGIREGLWSTRYADGSVRTQGRYVAGLRDGSWETFSAHGALLTEVDYAAGSRSGAWRAYSEAGDLLEEGQYSGNSQSGPWVKYYSDGQIKERGLFVNGLREGPWEFYDDIGLPTLQSGEYRAGIKVQ
ncbi:MAG: antitoxin component YwqK of YwqJK toxin-antitoxin module [Paracoccaceae bacterium]|jgi:antitoxin component YwqK of YwqJK toxin-antitoxin module